MGTWSWCERQCSVETLAKKALVIITTHKFTVNSFDGTEKYMEKFEGAMKINSILVFDIM